LFDEGFVVLGVSIPSMPEGPGNVTFLRVNIEPYVFNAKVELVELDL
jgi:hypothetical protein